MPTLTKKKAKWEAGTELWNSPLVVTMDGMAGSGKSTLARALAERLGFHYIDTGATYRALAWLALQRGINMDAEGRLELLARQNPATLFHDGDRWAVRITGVDITDEIRTEAISAAASELARHDQVRAALLEQQQAHVAHRDCVIDGRDAGTMIYPDAAMKLIVEATAQERARRRAADLGTDKVDRIKKQIEERDHQDAPQSVPADDAIQFDTTDKSIDACIDELEAMWVERRCELFDDELTGGKTAAQWIEGIGRDKFNHWYKGTRWFFKGFFRLEVHGHNRIPDGGCLIIANHASMWDPAFIMEPLQRPVRYMAKEEATRIPIYNRMLDAVGGYPVRRGVGDRVALHIGEMILRNGEAMGIFPEGTRIYDEPLGRPKRGAARLALVTGVPIIPVAIHGNRYADTAFKVKVAVGEPIDCSDMPATPSNVAAATLNAWDHVRELWYALDQDR